MVQQHESEEISDAPTDNAYFKGQNEEDMNKINSFKSSNNEIVARYIKKDCSPTERVKFEGLDDKDSIYSEDSENDNLPPIPDGGWGWVVVASAFLVSACADGLGFSFGLLREEFTRYFETTQSKTSLIGSLFIATPLLAGPIMSALVDRFGCRLMTMIAGILSTIGFLLASISDSVGMLCLTFGFLSGTAMGILYVTSVVSVAFWFDKRRNLAVSLASCGIGFGTLIYSPLTHYFLDKYDWRNTIVLLAGSLLNMCVCGALMRDPEWMEIKQKRERMLSKVNSRRSSSAASVSSRSIGGDSVFISAEELKSLLKSGKSPDYILATLVTSIAEAEKLEATTQMNAELSFKRMHSAIHLPTFIQHNENVPSEVLEKLMENKLLYNVILQNFPDIITRRRSEVNLNVEGPPHNDAIEPTKLSVQIKVKKEEKESKLVGKNKEKSNPAESNKENHIDTKREDSEEKTHINTNPLQNDTKPKQSNKDLKPTTSWVRQISSDHHYLKDMPLHRNTIMHRGAMMNISRYRLKALSLPDMYRNSMWSLTSSVQTSWRDQVYQVLKSTFDFRMFTELHFLIFNVASLILSIWFIIPYFFLTSYMTACGISGGEMMIGIIGIASSIGIVLLGWAGDQPMVNVTKTYTVCLIVCGLSVFAYPFFIYNYWALTVISTIFGLSFASSYSYTPTILMELMPIENFTIAYGLILLSQGIGHLIGPPIGGLLYDLTGTWDLTFYMSGVWLVVAGLCVGVIPYISDKRMCGQAQLLKEADDEKKAEEVQV